MNAFFLRKKHFFLKILRFSSFLVNPQISKSIMASKTLLHMRTSDCFLRTLNIVKMQFVQMVMQLMANISKSSLALF